MTLIAGCTKVYPSNMEVVITGNEVTIGKTFPNI